MSYQNEEFDHQFARQRRAYVWQGLLQCCGYGIALLCGIALCLLVAIGAARLGVRLHIFR